jgi:type II secretory pathway component GspD/PulD (secretin)
MEMYSSTRLKHGRWVHSGWLAWIICWLSSAVLLVAGCRMLGIPDGPGSKSGQVRQIFHLKRGDIDKCGKLISQMGFEKVSPAPDANGVNVTATPAQLRKVSSVVELIDTEEDYVVDDLGPASYVRTMASNSQIAASLGAIDIGTFANPPRAHDRARGIIDIQNDHVLAIIPAGYVEPLATMLRPMSDEIDKGGLKSAPVAGDNKDTKRPRPKIEAAKIEVGASATAETPKLDETPLQKGDGTRTANKVISDAASRNDEPALSNDEPAALKVDRSELTDSGSRQPAGVSIPPVGESATEAENDDDPTVPKTLRLFLEPPKDTVENQPLTACTEAMKVNNGEDVLDLNLPETLTLGELIDLAGKHLELDYVYTPGTVGKQAVSLKLNGSLRGRMRIKDLYKLLETVLKFNGLAMIRREEKLVTIVPVAEALEADPRLVNVNDTTIPAGDTVVTRVFELRYVDVTSVTNLLQNLKLGVTVSTLQEIRALFVTCYAHRMARIERLVEMLDRPGRLKECRFRRLQYATATEIAGKVGTLARELRGIPVALKGNSSDGSTSDASGVPVYLDTDDRNNRIVMIGHEEQLELLEELIDVLDVGRQDRRIQRVYNLRHLEAREALGKLEQLEVLGPVAAARSRTGASGKSSSAGTGDDALTEEPIVVILEATNQLLVKAIKRQHELIEDSVARIDVSLEDLRTLRIYEIQHVDADRVRSKLEGLGVTDSGPSDAGRITGKAGGSKSTSGAAATADILGSRPQVVVTESTNSLLINATTEQHERIAELIGYIDSRTPEEDIPYRIHLLENSSPRHVANILEQLIRKKTEDKEGKIEQVPEVPAKPEDQITIVPDPNTFSLIVYASRKNQQWIGDLIENLDKRRPQVLIDVTLVEITRTDSFEYDLNLVASVEEAVIENIGIDPLHRIDRISRIEGGYNLPDAEGNATGQTRAFFSDGKVQALLTAIKRKNYGRVLAKPKILVDDGQQGKISTTDETTYVKESIQVPDQGAPITTRDFEAIEASIQLQITPHISEGNLLRLEVNLSREDFGTRPQSGAPPDKATSEVTTTVFVPDKNTVILGGLVKLNQSKNGSKIPLLGDIPLLGAAFNSVDNSDVEKKLYVFLKANIVRPYDEGKLEDLHEISQKHRTEFERSETEFQEHENIPGIKPAPMQPERVLEEL